MSVRVISCWFLAVKEVFLCFATSSRPIMSSSDPLLSFLFPAFVSGFSFTFVSVLVLVSLDSVHYFVFSVLRVFVYFCSYFGLNPPPSPLLVFFFVSERFSFVHRWVHIHLLVTIESLGDNSRKCDNISRVIHV